MSADAVTATVTTPHLAARGAVPDDLAFMEAVVAWPRADEPGYINLHWTSPKGPGVRGKPFREVHEFMNMARHAATKPSIYKEIYFCLSTQGTTGKAVHGHATAHRSKQHATLLKALWLDVDVKEGKGYATLPEAIAGINAFVQQAKMPPPSALVFSGGGVHVYWISKTPLTPKDWRPYAEGLKAEALRLGLKCDAGLTTDEARILRLPGTFNNKQSPARRVKLAHLGAFYDFSTDLAHLPPLASATAPKITAAATGSGTALPYDISAFAGKPMPLAFQQANLDPQFDSLAEGINLHSDLPLDPTEVIKNCLHYRDAFATEGAHHSEPLWNLTLLGSAWFENNREFAHKFSKGYPTYSYAETDTKFDQKLTARTSGTGWPSCQAFESAGAKCKTCPFYGKSKSPLHLASRIASQTQNNVAAQAKTGGVLPVAFIRSLYKAGADREKLFDTMNETYAAVRYGKEVLVASIIGPDVTLMEPETFHKMFANLRFRQEKRIVEVSRLWWEWPERREYLGRGVVFEPGGPLEVADDMLNLWRGYGIEPEQGDWSLLRDHILNVVCSRNREHFDYLIRWMALAAQRPHEPIGVAIAFRGAQGAGKGIVARTFGKLFGKHFAHIANGEHLTGRFNASVAASCAVFLDEALWAGDRKGEGVLKALITEPRLQLEAKFRDPIMVENRLRILVASNNDWCVPAGIGDRRWFILDVADTYAGTTHGEYWKALHAEIEKGGAAAMFYDLLHMDLSGFDVRAVPHTAAKAQQQAHSLQGTEAWLYHVLQEGSIGSDQWREDGVRVSKDHAYACFEAFSKQQRAWRPDIKDVWSKKVRLVLRSCVVDTRPNRVRSFQFAPLKDCRSRFEVHAGAPNIEWDAETGSEPLAKLGSGDLDLPPPLGPTFDLAAPTVRAALDQAAADFDWVTAKASITRP